ncbi:MAG: replication factor C large subunit [Candidatus Aenigmatarchaeota archaeon]
MLWVEKYKPRKTSEVVGQEKALEQFLLWYRNWKPGKKAALLVGPPGVGKTCLVHSLAVEKNLQIVELNASDFRSASQIKEILGQSMKQLSFLNKGKIFLIDEIDGLTGTEDRGGISEIIKIIKESKFPVVLITNDEWDPKIANLKNYTQIINFSGVNFWSIVKKLGEICEKEGVKVNNEILKQIAKISDGDLRAAINDLESVCKGKETINQIDLNSLGYREREENVFEAMKIIFKTKSISGAKMSIENIDKDPEEIFWWIEQNIINEYEKPEEISMAYEFISRADIFRSRISRRQYWKLMKYMIDLMTGGVAISKKEMYRKFSKYERPDKIKYMSMTKFKRADEKEKLIELSSKLHCSTKKIKEEFLPYFSMEELVGSSR